MFEINCQLWNHLQDGAHNTISKKYVCAHVLRWFNVLCQVETEETMTQIQKDSQVANETKIIVQKEEKEATVKAEKTQTIADDAQRDLDEALPMLDAALASLKSLNKNDVVEVGKLEATYPLRF